MNILPKVMREADEALALQIKKDLAQKEREAAEDAALRERLKRS